MWFRLARELGMSVRRCQREVDSAEFTRWMAYAQIERWGPDFDDIRMGSIAAAIYNVNRDAKAHPQPFGPSDIYGWMKPAGSNEPILLDDPAEQTALIRAKLFGARHVNFKKAGGNGKANNSG